MANLTYTRLYIVYAKIYAIYETTQEEGINIVLAFSISDLTIRGIPWKLEKVLNQLSMFSFMALYTILAYIYFSLLSSLVLCVNSV